MVRELLMTKLKRLHQRVTGSTIEYDLSRYYGIVDEIKRHQSLLTGKTDQELKQLSQELSEKARQDRPLKDLLITAYALVNEASWRVLKLRPFDVQVIGGIVMHEGKLAEMQTGEGKTLAAVFPVYLNALAGRGVHVLTFNDYLARRDARWMGSVYKFLGLDVGYIHEGMNTEQRQKAYAADITYITAKEAGFDFLRDSLCYSTEAQVHRGFNFTVIDEIDSILIDEARIPLIIAGASDDTVPDTYRMASIASTLENGKDIEFDDYIRNVYLTDSGLSRVEELLCCGNLYDAENIDVLTRINSALHAKFLLHRDVDYVVRNGMIELVDEFTGRIADKQRWPDGIQAALEAKEKVSIKTRGTVLNSITLQHFIQIYSNISGMTGTAQSAESEFQEFYDLDIVVIPPNKPCIRTEHKDMIFRTKAEKYAALMEEISKVNSTRRPVLVGTRSVEESADLAQMLRNNGVCCEVLNAKNDEHEAQIIAQAGKIGTVTISTNMAGRGTDICLGGVDEIEKEIIVGLGGLYVIGTNKHESKRIDKQLCGRAGRQGDPGSSRLFVSFEDDLFVKYKIGDLIPSGVLKEHQYGPIENKNIRKGVESIQRIIEGQHLEMKKTLSQYSAIIEQQRKIIFGRREQLLHSDVAIEFFKTESPEIFNECKDQYSSEHLNNLCRKILLYYIDSYWSLYLADIAELREGIHLHRIGGRVPHFEFQKQAINIFADRLKEIDDEAINYFNNIGNDKKKFGEDEKRLKIPSATWTYLVNDDPFDNLVEVRSIVSKILQRTKS